MSANTSIHLSRRANWSRPKPMSAIQFDTAAEPEPSGLSVGQEGDANTTSAKLGVLLGSQRSTVVFLVGRELAVNGGPRVTAFSTPEPFLPQLPSTWEDFVTRVRAAIRHSNPLTECQVASFGDVRVDFARMEVTRLGARAMLTAQEFKTLKFFVTNPGRVISRDELLNEAWGYDSYPCTRTVDNHVLRLRQKLESVPSDPVHFVTVHRAGYKFVP